MLPERRVRLFRLAALSAVAVVGAAVALALPGSSSSSRPVRAGPATTRATRPPAPPATTRPRSTTPTTATALTATTAATPTTTDPGARPQTGQLPTAADPVFQAHVRDLWRAVVDGNPAEATAFFFPLGAYIQVKGISDPVHDYQTRLLANFDQDVQTLHAALTAEGGPASFTGVTVPDTAAWILPGVEYNKGSYWRVYGTRVSYTVAAREASFEITSMISWRGEWYVVHLGQIR